jgi:hypothetical protein
MGAIRSAQDFERFQTKFSMVMKDRSSAVVVMVVRKGSFETGAIVLGCLGGMVERTIYVAVTLRENILNDYCVTDFAQGRYSSSLSSLSSLTATRSEGNQFSFFLNCWIRSMTSLRQWSSLFVVDRFVSLCCRSPLLLPSDFFSNTISGGTPSRVFSCLS